MKPSIGRIVHYQVAEQIPEDFEPPLVPAIITGVHGDMVDLTVFYRSDFAHKHRVPLGEGEGHWRWPERV